MTGYLYPRLNELTARQLIQDLAPLSPPEIFSHLQGRSEFHHPSAVYYATGSRVPSTRLGEVRRQVVSLAQELGFPAEHANRLRVIGGFDRRCAGLLYRTMEIVPADAAASGVWSFLSLVVLPDVVIWRYPKRSPVRLMGHPRRNALRRLWWRAHILGAGPEDPPALLGEDQLVAIMERPTLGGDRRVARSLCQAYLHACRRQPDLPPMWLMREAAKRLIRLTPFIALGALTDEALGLVMAEVVGEAAVAIGHAGVRDEPMSMSESLV